MFQSTPEYYSSCWVWQLQYRARQSEVRQSNDATLVFVTKDQEQVLTSRVQDLTETCIFMNSSHLLLREEQTLAWDMETEYIVKKAGEPS